MNYEKIIVELLGRIQVLEEKVESLMEEKDKSMEKKANKIGTAEIREYIMELKAEAKRNGKNTIILVSGDIHKELKLVNFMPPVCNAMRQCMNDEDIILHTTPKGDSSTIKIQYYI